MLRSVLAGFAGLLAASLVVFAVEFGNSLLYPFPAGFDTTDQAQLAAFIGTMPAGAFVAVWVGWVLGALVGPLVAKRLAPGRASGPAIAVAVLFALFCAFNMLMLPHPIAFVVASIVATPLASLAALKLGARRPEEPRPA